LLDYYERKVFPVISFDENENSYKQKLADLLPQLGLSLPPDKFIFFEADLRHGQSEDVQLPEEIQNCYNRLLKIAI
jgi:hypothetical protein